MTIKEYDVHVGDYREGGLTRTEFLELLMKEGIAKEDAERIVAYESGELISDTVHVKLNDEGQIVKFIF